MIENIKSYSSVLVPNARKRALLEDTLDHLRKGSAVFFNVLCSLYGGLNQEIIASKFKKADKIDFDLMLATFWFRPFAKTDNKVNFVHPHNLIKIFENYLGHKPSEVSLEYLKNIDEKYQWVDCVELYKELCIKIGTTPNELKEDLKILVIENLLPIQKGEVKAWNIISKLFGQGEKEDRGQKVKILKSIRDGLNQLTKDSLTIQEYKEIALAASNTEDIEEFKSKYCGKSGGRDCSVTAKVKDKDLNKNLKLKDCIEECEKKINEKSNSISFKNNFKLRDFIEKEIGFSYYANSWSEMLKNALADIRSKNSINYRFAEEQYNDKEELEKLSSEDGILNAVNDLKDRKSVV